MIRAEKLNPPGLKLALATPVGSVASHSGCSAWAASSFLVGLLMGGAPALPIARPPVKPGLNDLLRQLKIFQTHPKFGEFLFLAPLQLFLRFTVAPSVCITFSEESVY